MNNLQTDFTLFTTWAHDNGLIINEQKTCILHIHPKNMKFKQDINIKYHDCDCLHGKKECNCSNIILQEKTKYLGITVDNRLTWKEHIATLNKRLRACTAVMYKLQNKATDSIKRTVYKALFESVIRYGVNVWGTASNSHLNTINTIQKRCLKALGLGWSGQEAGLGLYLPETQYSIGKQLTPKGLYVFNVLVRYHRKGSHKIQPPRSFNTRNSRKYDIPVPYTGYGQRLHEYIVPFLYNKLPNEIESIVNHEGFKTAVFKWLTEPELT